MILVTGSTGQIGCAVVGQLVQRGERPGALVRNTDNATRVAQLGAQAVPGDLERPSTLADALRGVDRMLLLTPLHPRQDQLQAGVITAARQAGVEHVVKISAFGAHPHAEVTIHRQHGRAERALVDSGMGFTHLRPNAFMQNLWRVLAAVADDEAITLPVGDARVSMIHVRDVAAAAVETLTASGHAGHAYDLTGPASLSYHEMAAQLSDALGRPIRYVDIPAAEARVRMREAGMSAWAVDLRLELYASYRAGAAERLTTAVADITGRQPRRFAQFAQELAGLPAR